MLMNVQPLVSRLLITRILSIVMLTVVSACAVSESTCDDVDFSEYSGEITITGIVSIRVMRHNDDLTWSQANDTTATAAESLRILIEMDHIRQQESSSVTSEQPEKTAWQQLVGSLRLAIRDTLVSTAHACEPVNNNTKLKSRVVGIDLTSSQNYRDTVAGDSLRSEFSVSMTPYNGIEPENFALWYRPISINNILSAPSSAFRPASSYRFEPTIRESSTSDGRSTELHQFTFSIELDTGELFTVTSQPMLIAI